MDFYQEANWYFSDPQRVVWYRGGIQASLLKPRVPRFGAMTRDCATGSANNINVCDATIAFRTNPELFGLPAESANPLALFADVGNLELSDPCRICIETAYNQTIHGLYDATIASFGVLTAELTRYRTEALADDEAAQAEVDALIAKTGQLSQSITLEQVDEFYYYYVARGLYAELGAPGYLAGYAQFQQLIEQCNPIFGMVCPEMEVTEEQAKAALLNHADNVFSSVTTAGIPFPFWSEGDGTGFLFGGSSPVSGSGIDMSADVLSLAGYLDLTNFGTAAWTPLYSNGYADPLTPDPLWIALVEKNPIYAWFMAGLTEVSGQEVCKSILAFNYRFLAFYFSQATSICAHSLLILSHSLWKWQFDGNEPWSSRSRHTDG